MSTHNTAGVLGGGEQSVEMAEAMEGHPGKPSPPNLSGSLAAAALDRSSEKLKDRPRYILHPEAEGMRYWDAVTTIALIFTSIITPVEVSFLPAPTSALDPLFCINRLVDAVFILDMALQFFLMFKSKKPQGKPWHGGP